ncbi:hypothetical protein CC1G_09969 [Coprinopsis cinerea okayama7|uniref:Translation initiation factor 3 N-terminal domain-containing protein n=1 Tax=Coprinopsis cinerea (strain Okayama-7 / 130 / ATCC MYA-4618 / FGSC 9003) TaxID=240176 RepID=A8PGT5_COPC7|nr:hypothetical protein CC1G_09969 [Coprinopsis cinerea okayama7\|eukprot:XP_001841277.1 hypothetical protein CC1G_09969 [Coprinopsis cinerea okayama7\
MNAFTAFRSAAKSVLRPPRPPPAVNLGTRCSAARFHTTPIVFKKKNDLDLEALGTDKRKQRMQVPKHNPTPKKRRNEKIGLPFVQLLDTQTNTPGPMRPLQEILDSLNLEEYYVELVSETPPVVRIVDIKEARAGTLAERQKSKRGAGQKDMHKEAQLTWSMAEADEAHKLSKVREDLEKGYRVDIVFSPKPRARAPAQMEMRFKLEEVRKKFDDVAKEWKAMSVDKRMGVLYLQSKVKVTAKVDREVLKESIPKSVLEKRERIEREQKHLAMKQQQAQKDLESSYQNLWGV